MISDLHKLLDESSPASTSPTPEALRLEKSDQPNATQLPLRQVETGQSNATQEPLRLGESDQPSSTQEPLRLEQTDQPNATNAIISSSEERDFHSKRIQQIVEQVLPLPKPFQVLVSRVLIRLVGDVKNLLAFARRQLDAVVGVLRDRIAQPSSPRSPAADTLESTVVAELDQDSDARVGEL